MSFTEKGAPGVVATEGETIKPAAGVDGRPVGAVTDVVFQMFDRIDPDDEAISHLMSQKQQKAKNCLIAAEAVNFSSQVYDCVILCRSKQTTGRTKIGALVDNLKCQWCVKCIGICFGGNDFGGNDIDTILEHFCESVKQIHSRRSG